MGKIPANFIYYIKTCFWNYSSVKHNSAVGNDLCVVPANVVPKLHCNICHIKISNSKFNILCLLWQMVQTKRSDTQVVPDSVIVATGLSKTSASAIIRIIFLL